MCAMPASHLLWRVGWSKRISGKVDDETETSGILSSQSSKNRTAFAKVWLEKQHSAFGGIRSNLLEMDHTPCPV